MHEYPQRTKYTRWSNERPICDINEALHLLAMRSQTNDPYCLSRRLADDREIWELVAPWYSEGDSGGDRSGEYYFQIDHQLVPRLIKNGFVMPHERKYWGGTELIQDKLVITQSGREAVRAFEQELIRAAKRMLRPGIDTDLTGQADCRDHDREFYWHGRFYVKFARPENGGYIRVFPESGIIEEC